MAEIIDEIRDESFELDPTGKINIDEIYNKADPRAYYSTLRHLNYLIPQFAKPIFQRTIDAYRQHNRTGRVRLLDLGCSYGVNAALLKCDVELEHLYELYDIGSPASRADLLARDRDFYARRRSDTDIEVIGLDASRNAVRYALEAGLLDGGISRDLENEPLDEATARAVSDVNLVISTGCIGYVGAATLGKIIGARSGTGKPWMAHFVLRMFPFGDIAASLASAGYITEKAEGVTFFQRRFASEEEQESVLARLDELNVDPTGKEADGWYHAEFYLSRPVNGTSEPLIDVIAPT